MLLLGGHGKVALLLTPLLLARGWDVTSVIRDASQGEDILSAAANISTLPSHEQAQRSQGRVTVLVRSLDDVQTVAAAQALLNDVQPDFVVWAAGAGGRGGAEQTYRIDRDAAKYLIEAATAPPSSSSSSSTRIRKFLSISALSSRPAACQRAPWWTEDDWVLIQRFNGAAPHYAAAKLEADEFLTARAAARRTRDGGHPEHGAFQEIILRPGRLTDEPPAGRVSLGRTRARGSISRADVAAVAAALLDTHDARGWLDLLDGEQDIETAVETVVRDKVDSLHV